MSIHINILEAELEATRKKISETKYLSFSMSALLVTEQKLEQALADAHLDEPVTLQDLLAEYKEES